MPDIDIDFCYERRGEVIEYVNRKYGVDNVAQIVTFGTMAARLAIRDVGRALNVPYGTVDEVAKQVPMELKMTISKALEINHKLKELYEADAQIKKLIDTAIELEGLPRHTSTHAAGVVITSGGIGNFVPLQKNEDVITTQFTMTTIERLGLLKMDFLGLRTLTVIRDAVRHLDGRSGIDVNIDELPFDDADVYNMISDGDTDGVFQLESSGMKQFMKELKPGTLEDIIAGISLYRPGPMDSIPMYVANKNHPSQVRYKHPMLEHILDVTYGCIVYQEQVMQIVRELGGYSLGRADLVRRAMSKKKADVMEKERQNFIYGTVENGQVVDGAVKRGVDEKTAAAIFDEMMDFASYAFNKSHAAAYAVVAYQTAWLKAKYPVEFFAALMTSFIESSEKVTKYIDIVKKRGITVLPPDINKSGRTFTVDEGRIRFGLAAIKNVGGAVVDEIEAERNENGNFVSFTDFCERMAGRKINKRVVESLIKCGSFDSLNLKRSVLLTVYERVIDDAVLRLKNIMPGQIDMFGELTGGATHTDNFKDLEEFPKNDMLSMEKECVGMYVSGHPLDAVAEAVRATSTASVLEIIENENHRFNIGSQVTISGIITKTRDMFTKKGELMRYAEFEDLTGSMEVIIFPSLLRRFNKLLCEEAQVTLSGNLDITEESPPKLRLEDARRLDSYWRKPPRIYLRLDSRDVEKMARVKEILKDSNGTIEVIIKFSDTGQVVKAPKSMMPEPLDASPQKLEALLGAENVKLVLNDGTEA